MGHFTILQMFENPRRGRQARNFTTNVPKILVLKSSSEQIFSRKLPLGAPDHRTRLTLFITCIRLRKWYNRSFPVSHYLVDFSSIVLATSHWIPGFIVCFSVLGHSLSITRFWGKREGGGRKGGTNTAIPHMVAREYRNTASKFSQIPKPQLQMGKSWHCQYYKSSFQIETILLCQCFQIMVRRCQAYDKLNIRLSHSFNIVPYMYAFT